MDTEKLKELRLKHDLTQKEVAGLIGISRSGYTMIENGKRNPSLKIAKNIVDLFGEEAKEIIFTNEIA